MKNAPFPIPIQSTMAEPMADGAWFYYTGYIEGSAVVVKHTGDIDFLHKMGFFGKGVLSRSEPSFHERKQKVNVRVRKLVKGATEPKPTLIRATVTSKRNYLTHKRYKALSDGNGTEYNYIIHCEEQQKLGLEGLSDEEETKDDEDEEEEEEEEEDEESDSDDGGPGVNLEGGSGSKMLEAFLLLSGGAVQSRLGGSTPNKKLNFQDASKETRMSVVALLSELAEMSQEKIATFAKVPHSLPQLKEKYGLLRRAEVALAQRQQKQEERYSKQEVIDVDDVDDDDKGGGGDSVMVLDSDEEGANGSEETVSHEKKSVEATKKTSKGWGDYDEGDVDDWGSTDDTSKTAEDAAVSKNGNVEDSSETKNSKGDAEEKNISEDKMEVGDSSNTNKQETDGAKSKNSENNAKTGSEMASQPDKNISEGKNSVNESGVGNKDLSTEDTAVPDKSPEMKDQGTEEKVSDSSRKSNGSDHSESPKEPDPVNGDNDAGKKPPQIGKERGISETTQDSPRQSEGHVSDNVNGQGSECPPATSSGGNKDKTEKTDLTISGDVDDSDHDEDASNDSEDVICIEADSATPSSVHSLLSQPSRGAVVTKAVTFMSNITSEPTYVNARVGFNSWDSIVHFNYSGDLTHLPTVMSVGSQSASSRSNGETGESEGTTDVYERLFPPVTTLLPGLKSDGAVIKQRLKGLPCLTPAYFKLSKFGASSSSSSSLFSSLMATDTTGNDTNSNKRSSQSSSHPQNKTTKSKFFQSTPHPSHTRADVQKSAFSDAVSPIGLEGSGHMAADESAVDESSNELNSTIVVESSVDQNCTSAQALPSQSQLHPEVVKKYLKVFSVLDPHIKDSDSDAKKSSLASLSHVVCQLKDLFTQSDSNPPDSPQVASLLTQFHTDLTKYLPEVGVTPDKEPDLLKNMIPTTNKTSAFSGDLELLDLATNLTKFQIKLLEERLNHLQKSLGNGSLSVDTQNKRKNDNLALETSDSKKIKLDSCHGNSSKEDVGLEECEMQEGSVYKKGNNSSGKIHQASTDEKEDTSKPENSDLSSNSKPQNSEKSVDEKLEKGAKVASSKENSSNIPNSSSKEKEDMSNKTIEIEDSVMEEISKTKLKNVSSVSVDSTPGKTKLLEKKKQGSPNESVDRISIGSSSEEDDDESDSDSSEDSISVSTLDARSLCKTDDPDGDLFVINNTSEEEELDLEDESQSKALRNAHRWKPCVKEDPYPVQERLHLMLEEAFFLSYGLGCLRIIDPELKVLDLKETWGQFQVLKEQFVPHYVAYHYFRSKGWVPKSGLKFGCDFILYREGPPFYHGSYSVVVQCVQEGSLLPCTRREGYPLDHRHLNWISLAGLNRITEHVAKELMFCYVIWPKGLGRQELSSPECIRKFKVKEVLVSRWISSQERENKTEEDMP